jgi:hypothetical protein
MRRAGELYQQAGTPRALLNLARMLELGDENSKLLLPYFLILFLLPQI